MGKSFPPSCLPSILPTASGTSTAFPSPHSSSPFSMLTLSPAPRSTATTTSITNKTTFSSHQQEEALRSAFRCCSLSYSLLTSKFTALLFALGIVDTRTSRIKCQGRCKEGGICTRAIAQEHGARKVLELNALVAGLRGVEDDDGMLEEGLKDVFRELLCANQKHNTEEQVEGVLERVRDAVERWKKKWVDINEEGHQDEDGEEGSEAGVEDGNDDDGNGEDEDEDEEEEEGCGSCTLLQEELNKQEAKTTGAISRRKLWSEYANELKTENQELKAENQGPKAENQQAKAENQDLKEDLEIVSARSETRHRRICELKEACSELSEQVQRLQIQKDELLGRMKEKDSVAKESSRTDEGSVSRSSTIGPASDYDGLSMPTLSERKESIASTTSSQVTGLGAQLSHDAKELMRRIRNQARLDGKLSSMSSVATHAASGLELRRSGHFLSGDSEASIEQRRGILGIDNIAPGGHRATPAQGVKHDYLPTPFSAPSQAPPPGHSMLDKPTSCRAGRRQLKNAE